MEMRSTRIRINSTAGGGLLALVLAATPLCGQNAQATRTSPLAFLDDLETGAAVSAGWDSMYLAEGRDDLADGGLFHGAADFALGPVAFGAWYADATDVDYNELNLAAELGVDLTDRLSAYAGYTYLAFFEGGDNTEDNEVGAGLAYTVTSWLEGADRKSVV